MPRASLCILALLVVIAFADNDPCTVSTSMGTIYLRNLTLPNDAFHSFVDNKKYWVNICGLARGFPSANICNSAGPSKAYQIVDDKSCYAMSSNDTTGKDTTVTLLDQSQPNKGVLVHYNTYTVDNYRRDVYITILCSIDQDPVFDFDREDYEPYHSSYYFNMRARQACPDVPTPAPTPAPKNPCIFETTLGTIDLRGMTLPYVKFFAILTYYRAGAYNSTDNNGYTYFTNICGPVTNFAYSNVCERFASSSKSYQLTQDKSHCFPMTADGLQDTSVSLIDASNPKSGVNVHYAGYSYLGYTREIYIQVACDPSVEKSTFTFVNEDYETGHSTFYYKTRSKYACPSRSSNTCQLTTPSGLVDLTRVTMSSTHLTVQDAIGNVYYVNICGPVWQASLPNVCKTLPASKAYEYSSSIKECYPMSANGTSDISLFMVDPSDESQGLVLKYDTFESVFYKRTIYIHVICDPRVHSNLRFDKQETGKDWSNFYFTLVTFAGCARK